MKTHVFVSFTLLLTGLGFSCSDDIEMKKSSVDSLKSANHIVTVGRRDTPIDMRNLTKPVDSIVVFKSRRKMEVFFRDTKVKSYVISLGNTEGAKRVEGDAKTPEGVYHIDGKNPNSIYYKNLGISYPNEQDKDYAKSINRSPGGNIKIHGIPNGETTNESYFLNSDWTSGCISVANHEIDELYKYVKIGCPILICP